jgi:phosphoserine aminotransferase
MTKRAYNFNPGPAALPLPVLEQVQAEFLDFKGTGMSVTEVSHRAKAFEETVNDAVTSTKKLLGLNDEYFVLFLQGGASLQFSMVPMNFATGDFTAEYVDTGTWSSKAIKEAQLLGKNIRITASSKDNNYSYIPKNISVGQDAAYLHLTSNNTIKGTQWKEFPNAGKVPIVCDMSSDIMSRPFDPSPFGCIFAGAQKNIGAAGVTMVIIRKDMLEKIPSNIPSMLRYTTFTESNSLYNTPPCFAIYMLGLVLKWIENTIGGLKKMSEINEKKAEILYNILDASDFYKGTAEKDSRSLMNVTFRLSSEELEKKFITEAANVGIQGIKGHRSVGGCRASIYNAVPLEAVEVLAGFMKEFAKKNG